MRSCQLRIGQPEPGVGSGPFRGRVATAVQDALLTTRRLGSETHRVVIVRRALVGRAKAGTAERDAQILSWGDCLRTLKTVGRKKRPRPESSSVTGQATQGCAHQECEVEDSCHPLLAATVRVP